MTSRWFVGSSRIRQGFVRDTVILRVVAFQGLFVRSAAHQNHLAHLKIKIIVIVLGDYGHFAGGASDAHGKKLLIVQKDLACVWFQNTVNALEEGGLAAAVGSDQSHKAMAAALDTHTFQDFTGAIRKMDIFC